VRPNNFRTCILDKRELSRRRRNDYVESDDEAQAPWVQAQLIADVEAPLNFVPMESSGDEYEGPAVIEDFSDDPGEGDVEMGDGEPASRRRLLSNRLRSQQTGDELLVLESLEETRTAPRNRRRRKKANLNLPARLQLLADDSDHSEGSLTSNMESLSCSASGYDLSEVESTSIISRTRSNSKNMRITSDSEDELVSSTPRRQQTLNVRNTVVRASDVSDAEFEEAIAAVDVPTPKKPKLGKFVGKAARKASLNWLLVDYPIWTPYRPQIGDIVYYIRAGHEKFAADVEPHIKIEVDLTLPEILLCKVKEIKYSLVPQLVCDITVAVYPALELPEDDAAETESTIVIRWFDIPKLPDFLILYDIYQDGLAQKFQMGDIVSARYGEKNLRAQVIIVTENETNWYRYQIEFEDADGVENFNPWELTVEGGTFSELSRLDDEQSERLKAIVENAMRDKQLSPFLEHIFQDYQGYLDTISYPMCMRLIYNRLLNGYYRHKEQVVWGTIS
jgi:hypothetical protein